MRCNYDALKVCIIGKYWWCMDCDIYGKIEMEKINNKIHRRDTRKCIFCEIVGAERKSVITKHHVIPLAIAEKHLQHKLGHSVYMCVEHHKLFHALMEPIIDILNSKSPPFRGMGDMTYWFMNVKLPELFKRIDRMFIQ